MADPYLEVISLIERLHRQFLEIVKLELEDVGIRDINNVQAMVLFNIGDAEMTVGELTWRGCYLGSNVSYNLKKMVDNGYLAQERSVHDRRSIHVKLTEKGRVLRDRLSEMHERHIRMLQQTAIARPISKLPRQHCADWSASGCSEARTNHADRSLPPEICGPWC